MSAPLTIAGMRAAFAHGTLDPGTFLRERLRELEGCQVRDADPAWIALATHAQLEEQLAVLAQRNPADCPLYGVPFAIKDNIDAAGWMTTAACPGYAYRAQDDAHVVARLRQAGAVLLGKTNLDQFATGLVGTRSPYGVVPNTFDATCICGGSSSGSASVVARGLVAFALGTDTAGSGRVPAGFNNLVGCKPTPGVVSTRGVVPACRTLDCVSVLALTAGDAAGVFAVLSGPGAMASGEAVFSQPESTRFGFAPTLRVGVPRTLVFWRDDYATLFDDARNGLDALDCEVAEFDLAPFSEVAALLYQGPWTAERYAVAGEAIENDLAGLDPVVAEVVRAGRDYSAVDAFRAQYRVREIAAQLRSTWDDFDVLMVPTAPDLPTIAQVADAPIERNSALGTYTNFVNLLGLSAVAVPSGFTPHGLPFGVTFIAPGGSDWALLDLAARWQRTRALPIGCNLRELEVGDTAIPVSPPDSVALAVVGAHLSGMPLHHQLTERGARLRAATHTAPRYRLYALAGGPPARPGLARVCGGGAAIAVEVYDMPASALGGFLAGIPAPLGLGSIELVDGRWVTGFICEPWGLESALDITASGGWREHVQARRHELT